MPRSDQRRELMERLARPRSKQVKKHRSGQWMIEAARTRVGEQEVNKKRRKPPVAGQPCRGVTQMKKLPMMANDLANCIAVPPTVNPDLAYLVACCWRQLIMPSCFWSSFRVGGAHPSPCRSELRPVPSPLLRHLRFFPPSPCPSGFILTHRKP